MKPFFIINEKAGNGRARQYWSHIREYLARLELPHESHVTAKPGEAIEVAREASMRAYSPIIAVGGDGTVNEVVNGLQGNGVLGVIPAGTGNDFARMLNIPRQPEMALRRLLGGRPRKVDLLEWNGKLVAGAVGIGIDGAIAADMNRCLWQKRWGTGGYVISMCKTLTTFQPFRLHLKVDLRELVIPHCWLVAVGNSKFYGGGMNICPKAKHDDGLLDLCVVGRLTRGQFLRLFPSVFSGRHIHHPKISYLQGRKVHVSTEPAVFVHGDGEVCGQTPGEILLRAQILQVQM